MTNIVSVQTMRNSDSNTIANGTPGIELMKRAGEFIFNSVEWHPPVAIVCGSGNNAGDGYVLATLLHDHNVECTIFLVSNKFSDDGKYFYDQCVENGVKVSIFDESTSLGEFNAIVDCLFGTGFKGSPKGLYINAINEINNCKSYIVSVDINSGLNGDSGMAELCVKSNLTVSIGTYKPGHFLNMAKDVINNKVNGDIGINIIGKTYTLVDNDIVSQIFKPRANFSNKSTYGYIALIGGSENYSGAIRLASMANAAMRSGSGVVMIATPKSISQCITPEILESTIYPLSEVNGHIKYNESELSSLIKRVKSIAFGMGIGISDDSKRTLEYLLTNYTGTLIVDADGITVYSQIEKAIIENRKCNVVLTPHNKEFSRLTNLSIEEILDNPIEQAEKYAIDNNVTLLLKGPSTIITNGSDTYITDAGCAGMATAGSGDVLSGIVAAICGFTNNTLLAVAASAYINGKSGELACQKSNEYSMVASDTVNCIKDVISKIIKH